MPISRYSRSVRMDNGGLVGTGSACWVIRQAVESGKVTSTQRTLREGERLDTLAGSLYGNSSYWWILAAASGIGWGLQVPPGTVINVPDLQQVLSLVR